MRMPAIKSLLFADVIVLISVELFQVRDVGSISNLESGHFEGTFS